MFCGNAQRLLTLDGATATVTGTTYRIDRTDNDVESSETWSVLSKLTQAGGATTPSATPYVELSENGTDWVRVPLADAGTDADETVYNANVVTPVCRYLRAVVVIAGGTAPAITGFITVVTSGDYRFTAV